VEEEVAYMAHRIVNKLLHDPTVQLKVQAVNGNGAVYSQVLETLFGLGNGSDNGTDTTRPH
jgi:glutamyl-tRNA reductase